MHKIIPLLIMLFVLSSCNLLEPSYLVIENNSDYTIKTTIQTTKSSSFTLDKNEDKFILAFPGKVNIKIEIPEIFFSNEYSINLNYQEKRKISFDIE